VKTLPFEPAMRFLASVQKGLALARRDRFGQLQLVRAVYGDSPIAAAGALFLRANGRGAIFSEQQLFALQRLLVLHARDEPAGDLTREENLSLRLAGLAQTTSSKRTRGGPLESGPPDCSRGASQACAGSGMAPICCSRLTPS